MVATVRRRAPLRWGLGTVSASAVAAGLLTVPVAAQAAGPNPYSPRHGHAYRHGAVPTVLAAARMRQWQAGRPAAAASGSASASNLSYGGGVNGIGVTTGTPRVYLVFYGSQWGAASTDGAGDLTLRGDPVGMAPRLQRLFKGLGTGGEQWSGVMTQYCEGVAALAQSCPAASPHVGYPTGGALAGVWAATSSASPAAATGRQLAQVAIDAAVHFGNTTPASNRSAQYLVVSPQGTRPDGFNTASGSFCAWHDYTGDPALPGGPVSSGGIGDIAFTNLPYVTDAGASCGAQFVNAGTAGALDGVTMVAGHEYSEVLTDQNPAGGWLDAFGEENADKCSWLRSGSGASANLTFSTGTFAMQTTWSNDVTDCRMTHPVVAGTGSTVAVTDPGPRSAVVGTGTSLQIAATDSAGLALSYSAVGLPPGLSIARSTGLISGTPSAAGTFSSTVTATDGTGATGSSTFSWTVTGLPGCAGAGQKLGNPGFETGAAAPWTASAGVVDGATGQPARTGVWKAWLNGYGVTHTDALSQTVTLPKGCRSYTFSFWVHVDTSETTSTTVYDRLTVKAGSSTLTTVSNLNRGTGYLRRSFSLAGYAGRSVTLRFTGVEDASLPTSFVVDDTAVTVA